MVRRTRRQFLAGAGTVVGGALLPTVSGSLPEDRFIVDVGDDVVDADRTRVGQAGFRILHDLEPVGYLVVTGREKNFQYTPYDDYAPDVELERNLPASAYEPSESELTGIEDTSVEPSAHFDPPGSYALQWDKQATDIPEALATSTGSGASVAILDSSIYIDHPDLAPNANASLSTNVTFDGFGVYRPFGNPHGTHVAGIAAGSDGGTVTGTATDAELIGVRVFSGPFTSFGTIAFGAIYAAQVADVINTSLGTPPIPVARGIREFLEEFWSLVTDFVVENDTLWVSSAGNSATNMTTTGQTALPAGADDTMSISATGPVGNYFNFDGDPSTSQLEPYDHPANFTDHGSDYVSVAAPGGDATLFFQDDDLVPEPPEYLDWVFNTYFAYDSTNGFTESWAFLPGTSMSSPQVAGLATLLAAENPDWNPREIRTVIERTATDDGSATYYGNGFIDPVAALSVDDLRSTRREATNPGDDGRDDRSRSDTGRGGSGGGSSRGGGGRGSSRGGGGGSSRSSGR